MTPSDFQLWLDTMRFTGLGRLDKDCAALLGIHPTRIRDYKREGTDKRTALACAALLGGLLPYGQTAKSKVE